MADDCCPCSNIVIMQLFHELKQQFPAVPDRVVSDCIRQNCHDKAACEELLRRENHGYLMHSYPIALKMSSPEGQCDHLHQCSERCCTRHSGDASCFHPSTPRLHSEFFSAIRETSQVIQNTSKSNNNNNESDDKNNVNRSVVMGGDSRCLNPSGVTGTQWFAQGSTTQYLPSPHPALQVPRDNSPRYSPTRLVGGDDSNLHYPTYNHVPYEYQRVESQSTTNSSQYFTQLDDNSNSPAVSDASALPSQCHVVASRMSVQSSTTYHKHCNRPCSLNVTSPHAPTPAPADHSTVENNLNYPLSRLESVGRSESSDHRARSALHVDPAPHYTSRNYWGGGGGTLAVSPTQQPRSYTSVNLTLRPPSLEPLPPIEIASAGTSLTYSTSSYDPQQGFQSQLQIRIGPGGVGSVSALRTRASDARPRSCYAAAASAVLHDEQLLRAESLPDVTALSIRSDDSSTQVHVEESLRSQLQAIGGDQLQAVTQALLAQQIERKNRLRRELKREKQKLRDMHRDVQEMTEDLARRQMRQRAANIALPVVSTVLQKVQSLRQEITFLQMECKKMTTEVDMSSDDQVPLGETDEAFYKNIYTGQRGCVLNLNRHPTSTAYIQEERNVRPPVSPLDVDGPNWTCTECTFRNHPLLDKCEQCEMPRIILGETQDIHIRVTHHNFPARRGVLHNWVV